MQKLLPIAANIIFISSSISCMEIKENINQTIFFIEHQKIITLYEKTYTTLAHYIAQESPFDKTILCDSANNIFEIINDANTLKENGVTEKMIGQFAYNQEPLWKEKIGLFPYGNFYVSVFYDRLYRYHDNLQKNEFSHPTQKNYNDYIANQKMKADQWATAKSAEKFGIYVTEADIQKTSCLFEPLSNSIAIKEFETLLQHIQLIRTEKSNIIKNLANMLYANGSLIKETK